MRLAATSTTGSPTPSPASAPTTGPSPTDCPAGTSASSPATWSAWPQMVATPCARCAASSASAGADAAGAGRRPLIDALTGAPGQRARRLDARRRSSRCAGTSARAAARGRRLHAGLHPAAGTFAGPAARQRSRRDAGRSATWSTSILTRDPWMHRIDIAEATGTRAGADRRPRRRHRRRRRRGVGRAPRSALLASTLTGPAGGSWSPARDGQSHRDGRRSSSAASSRDAAPARGSCATAGPLLIPRGTDMEKHKHRHRTSPCSATRGGAGHRLPPGEHVRPARRATGGHRHRAEHAGQGLRRRAGRGDRPGRRPLGLDHPPDRDHTGGLWTLLEAAPNARLVTTFIGVGHHVDASGRCPMDRVYLLNPGQQLDLGRPHGHRLPAAAVRQPGDGRPPRRQDRRAVRLRLLRRPDDLRRARLRPRRPRRSRPTTLRAAQLLWAAIDSPWVLNVDADEVRAPRSTRSARSTRRRSSAPTCRRRSG